jgi:hypothetical protein
MYVVMEANVVDGEIQMPGKPITGNVSKEDAEAILNQLYSDDKHWYVKEVTGA